MNIQPIEVVRRKEQESDQGSGLYLKWSDGQEQELDSNTLRTNCPCATCDQKRGDTSHSTPLISKGRASLKVIKSDSSEELDLRKVWLVGRYAIGMKWGDNHDSGIYTFATLRALSNDAENIS